MTQNVNAVGYFGPNTDTLGSFFAQVSPRLDISQSQLKDIANAVRESLSLSHFHLDVPEIEGDKIIMPLRVRVDNMIDSELHIFQRETEQAIKMLLDKGEEGEGEDVVEEEDDVERRGSGKRVMRRGSVQNTPKAKFSMVVGITKRIREIKRSMRPLPLAVIERREDAPGRQRGVISHASVTGDLFDAVV